MVGRSEKDTGIKAQKVIQLILAICASILSFFLAWPWSRDFSYWAESHTLWLVYFVIGFILAIYVFYVFLGSIRTLFEHDTIERAELATPKDTNSQEDQS